MRMRTFPLLSTLLAAVACAARGTNASAAHAAELITNLGGPAGFGVNFLDYNDDSSSPEIDVRAAFPAGLSYFGQSFTSLYVNNNGTISFGAAVGQYTPSPFPASDQRIIAPWWADVDTRGGGRPQRNGVYWDIRPGQFVATWHNVGYYGSHNDHENTFQVVIRGGAADDDGIWTVEFRYNRCEWTTGDASGGRGGFGGTPAQAGFDAGNHRDFRMLPGSRTRAILRLCTRSNVGEPGVFRFLIQRGRPRAAPRADQQ
jgi:hypothetical protein